MPIKQTVKQETKKNLNGKLQSGFRKAPGTRIGTLDDWREGSTKSGKMADPHGRSIRDGR